MPTSRQIPSWDVTGFVDTDRTQWVWQGMDTGSSPSRSVFSRVPAISVQNHETVSQTRESDIVHQHNLSESSIELLLAQQLHRI